MSKLTIALIILVSITNLSFAHEVRYEGLSMPESVAEGPDGNIYVSEIGEKDKDRDGKISKIDKKGNITTFATGLYDPKGIVFYKEKLYVTDRDVIIEVNTDGTWSVFGSTMAFPKTPVFLNDIDVDSNGDFYITDTGNFETGGIVFKMNLAGDITVLFDETTENNKAPNGVLPIGNNKILIVDWGGELFEADTKTKKLKKIGEGFPGGDGLAIKNGTVYISSWKEGKIYEFKNGKSKLILEGFKAAADIALSKDKTHLIIPDMKAGTVTIYPLK
jgi:gluconolactonase